MKKVLLFIAFISFVSTSFAQQNNRSSPEERQQKELKMLTKKLSLTEDQVKQVEGFQSTMMDEMTTLRENKTDRDVMREKMDVMRDAYVADVKGILTAEQVKDYEVILSERESQPKKSKKGKRE